MILYEKAARVGYVFSESICSQKGAAMSESYVGIDVHKKRCVYTEIDPTGKVVKQGRFDNIFEEVSTFASRLTSKVHVVLEPVLNYLWLLDQFEPYAGSMHVATPAYCHLRLETRSK